MKNEKAVHVSIGPVTRKNLTLSGHAHRTRYEMRQNIAEISKPRYRSKDSKVIQTRIIADVAGLTLCGSCRNLFVHKFMAIFPPPP